MAAMTRSVGTDVWLLLTMAVALCVVALAEDSIVVPTATGDPDRARCITQGTNCYQKILTCPKTCPSRRTVSAGKSACFIDCIGCRTSCRQRKPNCFGFGAVCYDPRFIGGDGVSFYFHGQKDQDFCIVSDRRLHVNAHFIGKRPEGRPRDFTWVQALGMVFDSHKITVGAKKVAIWDETVDQLALNFDGEDVLIPEHEGALWTSPTGEIVVERTAVTNSVNLVINELVEVTLSVVPVTQEESRVHKYKITDDDCFAHLNIQFKFFNLSPTVDGVLGQTYQPDFKNPLKGVDVPMPVMHGEAKFLSSSLLSTDCKASQFVERAVASTGADLAPKTEQKTPKPIIVQCEGGGKGGMTCRR